MIEPINHWYEDNKGETFLYCGKASVTNGYWEYPQCFIYLKYSTLLRHYKSLELIESLSVDRMLLDMANLGVRHYQFSQKPRKFVEDIGEHNFPELHGIVQDDTFCFMFQ